MAPERDRGHHPRRLQQADRGRHPRRLALLMRYVDPVGAVLAPDPLATQP